MAASIKMEIDGLQSALARLNAVSGMKFAVLMKSLAEMGQEQTRRRIESEKTTPEGEAWPLTTDGRAALFVTGDHLARSIDHEADATEAIWGSGWIGAKVHQFGATIKPTNARALRFNLGGKTIFAQRSVIPARPYLGVSAANEADLYQAAIVFIEGAMQ